MLEAKCEQQKGSNELTQVSKIGGDDVQYSNGIQKLHFLQDLDLIEFRAEGCPASHGAVFTSLQDQCFQVNMFHPEVLK